MSEHSRQKWCAIHGHETVSEYPYLVCGECGHCFETSDDLMKEHNRVMEEFGLLEAERAHVANTMDGQTYKGQWELTPEKVYICPFCAHDL